MKCLKISAKKARPLKTINDNFMFFQAGDSLIIQNRTRSKEPVIWLKLDKIKFDLFLSNFYSLTFISAYKIANGEFFIGTVIDGIESLRFLEINNLKIENSLLWQQVSLKDEIVIFNEKYPELSGYAFSVWDNSIDSLKKRAIFEYYERISSTNVDHIESVRNVPLHSKAIDYKQLGILWGTKSIPKVSKWVEAFSERDQNPVYILFNFVFYGNPDKGEDTYLGSSNGTAIGSSYQDSVQRALNEFIERDVLIESWLGRGANLVRLTSISQILGESFKQLCSLMNIKTDFFLYKNLIDNKFIVWCLVKTRKKDIFSSSGFASSENIQKCLKHSFDEAMGAIVKKEKNTKKNGDSTLDKIQNYYFDANNKQIIANLYKFKRELSLEDFYKQCKNISLTKRYRDIVVIDITPTAIAELGLSCVKVVALGGNSMIFNYKLEKLNFPKFLPIA